ncbi:MAG: KGG domain-containing protein [Flavitalea sp.]
MANQKERDMENTRETNDQDKKSGVKQNTSLRGFASMDAEKQREIASKGGKASHGGGRKPKNADRS